MEAREDGLEPRNERLDIILAGTEYFPPMVLLELNAQGECATSLMISRARHAPIT
jgi:hypothetical protein